MNDQERFFANTIPVPEAGCLLWTGHVKAGGYAQFRMKRRYQAHVAAWLLAGRELPRGLRILHKCDVRICVNVDHLFVGTLAENSKDMVDKGRSASGEKNSHAKLTLWQAAEIWASELPIRLLSIRYGISETQAAKIKRGECWAARIFRDRSA